MPFIELTTRHLLEPSTKAGLAEALTARMIEIEAGVVGDASGARLISWVTFQVIEACDWAIGGRFDETWTRGRAFAFAKVFAPEAILSGGRRDRVLAEIGAVLKEALITDASDDGDGIQVLILELPESNWGVDGRAAGVKSVLQTMGERSDEHYRDVEAHYAGVTAMKNRFAIPD